MGNVSSVGVAYPHGARGWRASVGNGARGRQHGHVEVQTNVLLPGVVDAANAVGLGVVGHELGVLLND